MSKEPATKRPPRTIKEKKVVKLMSEGKSATQAVRETYNVTSVSSATSIASQLLTKLDISSVMENQGLTDDVLISCLVMGLLDSNKIVGTANDFVEVEDYAVRHKYLETALKMKGLVGRADEGTTLNFLQFIQSQKNTYNDAQ